MFRASGSTGHKEVGSILGSKKVPGLRVRRFDYKYVQIYACEILRTTLSVPIYAYEGSLGHQLAVSLGHLLAV